MGYTTYSIRTKKRSKRLLQQLFSDSVSGLDVVGKAKVERNGAQLLEEVAEGMKVLDFSGNEVSIRGYCHYFIAPRGAEEMKAKKIIVTAAVTEDKLLIGLETMQEWGNV